MAGLTPPSLDPHGDALSSDDGSADAGPLDPAAPPDRTRHGKDGDSSEDGGGLIRGCRLDRRWALWDEFMGEHAHLDTWLRLVEQAVTTATGGPISHSASREQLRKLERLRGEAGPQLIRLDGLTRRNRTLSRLFQGVMRTRLLAAARECGRRWDDVSTKLETAAERLQLVVSEWEEFEAEKEELMLWLSDTDARLTEIDLLGGNNREKLRQLQSFKQSVCRNSGRINELLQRGEALIQRSTATDARRAEGLLLELLRRCSHVYSDIARTHTRLLSTRLVFEDNWVLTRPTDSGCPSESVQDDLELPLAPPLLRGEAELRLLAPPAPSSPTQEHLGLEWDPSVDVGRSVSQDDADSSYFSACAGLSCREEAKRWSYLSSFDSHSDISADITNQEAVLTPQEWAEQTEPGVFSGQEAQDEDLWTTSAPDGHVDEPGRFDRGRVKAWLRVQSSVPAGTSCSRAVQTDGGVKEDEPNRDDLQPSGRRCHGNRQLPVPWELPRDLGGRASAAYLSSVPQEEERSVCGDAELSPPFSYSSSPLLFLLLAATVALLAGLVWFAMEPQCHRSNRMSRSLHLTLSYVNGPPPT